MDIIDEIKIILKELSESQKDTDRELKETSRELKELGKETDRRIREVSRMVHGIADSNGQVAEQFFYSALQNSLSLNGQAFEVCSRNADRSQKIGGKLIADEFDIVLKRPDAIAIVEIKYRLRKDDVELLAGRKLENFRILYPEESMGKVIYLGAAGLSVDGGALQRAKELGIYVLTQRGEDIYLLNNEARAY